jgi:protein-S-isoprenylcysteine O-methyltransferase
VPLLICFLISLTAPAFLLRPLLREKHNRDSVGVVERHESDIQKGHPNSRVDLIIVILYSGSLGGLFYIGLTFIDSHLAPHFAPLGFYIILLSTFHFSEYFVTSITNPATLSLSSFLIDQSSAYIIAISSSFVEYLLEAYLIPDFKKFNVISMLGLVVAASGELVRKSAMFTAGENFTHFISVTKSPDHQLVTHGIYSIFRHPSYAGWFYWAIGSQIMLLNPICVVLFAVISYKFFKDRIVYEEALLVKFFKNEYINYKKKVGLWMPISV